MNNSNKKRRIFSRIFYMERKSAELHRFYGGKTEMSPKAPVRSAGDFSDWYTPGVGQVVEEVMKDASLSWQYTSRANTIAIISDGTRVLGYGKAGPHAALTVMEGKAMMFKYLGGVDAVPLCINVPASRAVIDFARMAAPSFGGINLEDIASPACYTVLSRLRASLPIPVWHDDAQGTATVCLAGMLNALELTGRTIGTAKIALIGAGAANSSTARLLITAGAEPKNLVLVDKLGALHRRRHDLTPVPVLKRLCAVTNGGQITGGAEEALRGADAVIAAAACGPGVIKPQWISYMARNPVVFALANPVPEIMPDEAAAAGAAVVATGRGDFPNQVNNCLAFPAVWRGVLDARASGISDSMCVSAAKAIAAFARNKGLRRDRIVPSVDDADCFARCAAAVAAKAAEEGLAQNPQPEGWYYDRAAQLIARARKETEVKMKSGVIAAPPPLQ